VIPSDAATTATTAVTTAATTTTAVATAAIATTTPPLLRAAAATIQQWSIMGLLGLSFFTTLVLAFFMRDETAKLSGPSIGSSKTRRSGSESFHFWRRYR
jgi:EamA domain-containing membrane protein RarD